MSTPNLQEVHDFLIRIAYQAGSMITSAKPAPAGLGTKKNSADLVTETDQAVEKMVSTALRSKFPDYDFMGEETYKPGDKLSDKPTFIVDPIDGTTNFFHGHPYLCVSLGLAVEQRPVVGVIYNPFTRQLYTAIKGQGAFLIDPFHSTSLRLPLKEPEPLQDLSHCLVAVEWGSDREGNDYEVKTATFKTLCATKTSGGAMVHGIRSLGSAELNLCAVAAGNLDLYWESGCWAWDVCAGWVIVEEAGGKIVGCHRGDWEPRVDQRRYMAVRGDGGKQGEFSEGQKRVVEEFWGCVKGRVEVGYDAVTSS
jgi:myo-inositol-1(or 4)-monophosphatase